MGLAMNYALKDMLKRLEIEKYQEDFHLTYYLDLMDFAIDNENVKLTKDAEVIYECSKRVMVGVDIPNFERTIAMFKNKIFTSIKVDGGFIEDSFTLSPNKEIAFIKDGIGVVMHTYPPKCCVSKSGLNIIDAYCKAYPNETETPSKTILPQIKEMVKELEAKLKKAVDEDRIKILEQVKKDREKTKKKGQEVDNSDIKELMKDNAKVKKQFQQEELEKKVVPYLEAIRNKEVTMFQISKKLGVHPEKIRRIVKKYENE